VQGRLAAGVIKRAAQDLAINRHHTLTGPGKGRHEALKSRSELRWIQQTKQPAECVIAR
jgi:hypothetical protein